MRQNEGVTKQAKANKSKANAEQKHIYKDKDKEKEKDNLEERSKLFANSLIPFKEKYGSDMLKAFYNYWSEPNPSKTKMRFELGKTWDTSKRLVTWSNNNFGNKNNKPADNSFLENYPTL